MEFTSGWNAAERLKAFVSLLFGSALVCYTHNGLHVVRRCLGLWSESLVCDSDDLALGSVSEEHTTTTRTFVWYHMIVPYIDGVVHSIMSFSTASLSKIVLFELDAKS